jgi:hypothetical protein
MAHTIKRASARTRNGGKYAPRRLHLSMNPLILELIQEAGIEQPHRAIDAAAPLDLGLREPPWH